MRHVVAFAAGLIFAVGLALGGMTDPLKVISFLDLFGGWDPSLAFVMGGAIAVYAPLYQLAKRRQAPVFDSSFHLPTRRDINPRLLLGAAFFGAGWGLSGFCPGPAVVSLMSFGSTAFIFVGSMLAGMAIFEVWQRVRG